MSVFEKLGFSHHDKHAPVVDAAAIERRELAHSALFTEVSELRDVCKFILQGHKNHVIFENDKPKINISCISGTTTRIKITEGNSIDDFSVSDAIISRKTTTYIDDQKHTTLESFDITRSYMNGFSEAEMTAQLKALYDLQEMILIADGYIAPKNSVETSEHYAA